MDCISTHGGAGYALGTHVEKNGDIVCGACKEVIGNTSDMSGKKVELPEWVSPRIKSKSKSILRRVLGG